MWLWKLGTLGRVGVNEVSAGTQRLKDGVGWPKEFLHRKEIWEAKNVRKIAGKIQDGSLYSFGEHSTHCWEKTIMETGPGPSIRG